MPFHHDVQAHYECEPGYVALPHAVRYCHGRGVDLNYRWTKEITCARKQNICRTPLFIKIGLTGFRSYGYFASYSHMFVSINNTETVAHKPNLSPDKYFNNVYEYFVIYVIYIPVIYIVI